MCLGSAFAASTHNVTFTSIAHSPFGGTATASHVVIDDQAKLDAFFHGHAPNVSVDFAHDLVLAVSMGARPTSGYSIEITRIESSSSGAARVCYVERGPGAFQTVANVVTQPVHVVKLARATHYSFASVDPGLPDDRYAASISPMTGIVPGHATTIDVRVAAPSGSQVKAFDPVHGETMHLIAVSQDLSDFVHVHPALRPAGDLEANVTLARAQPYAVFIEYAPKGHGEELTLAGLLPAGAHAAQPTWIPSQAFVGPGSREVVVDHTRVRLQTAPHARKKLVAGATAHVMIEVRDENGGPANVQEWLGMPGHAIVVSPDLSAFFHEHGIRGGAGTSAGGSHGNSMPTSMPGMGGMTSTTATGSMAGMPSAHYAGANADDLTFDLTLPAAGPYKVFFQFQRAGRVVTAPFWLVVSP